MPSADPRYRTFWSMLAPDDRAKIESVARISTYDGEDVLIREDETDDDVLIIRSGWAKVVASSPDWNADDVVVALRGSGDVVGELAVIGHTGRSATVRAVKPISAYRISGSAFQCLMRNRPTLGTALLQVVTDRLRESVRELAGTRLTSTKRLAHVLAKMCDRPGLATGTGTGTGVVIRLTQHELAQFANLSRESVARTLRQFRDDGVVQTDRGEMVVIRPDQLHAAANGHRTR